MATAGDLPGGAVRPRPPPTCTGADDLIGPRGLRHRKAHGTMQASSPTKRRARSCPVLQDISAAKRQCTPSSAPCGASTSPCRGGFIESLPPGRLPCKGLRSRAPPAADTARRSRCSGHSERACASAHAARCGHRKPVMSASARLRGAAPDLANTLPGSADPPGGRERPPYNAGQASGGAGNKIWRWFFGTMQASSPAQGRCGLYRLSVLAGHSQWFVGAGDLARRQALRYDKALWCGTDTKPQCFSAANFPRRA